MASSRRTRQGGDWAKRAGLNEPLIGTLSSSLPPFSDGGTAEAETAAAARAKALVVAQARLQTAGLLLYCAGFLIDGGSGYWYYDHSNHTTHDLAIVGGYFIAYALAQTAGLLCMGLANVDVDLHMRQRPVLALVVAVVIVAYAGLQAFESGTDRADLVSAVVRE